MPDSDAPKTDRSVGTARRGRWAKRLGVAGFLFFLIKGLLWLSLPAVAAAVAAM